MSDEPVTRFSVVTWPARLPLLARLVVDPVVGVHRERGVAVLHMADEPDDVAAVGRHAVALHGDLAAPAAQPHVAAREVVRPVGRLDHAPLPIHVVDLEGAPALGREPWRQGGEQRQRAEQGAVHWLSSRVWPGSSMPLPATPLGWSVTTFRKSGSERKLLPFRCWLASSKVNGWSVLMVLVALS